MKFGQVEEPDKIDFSLPPTQSDSFKVLGNKESTSFEVFVGCAKWNKQDLKGFYPRGTKDELAYYATQFNAIELNATFYNAPSKEQVLTWKNKTPKDFRFFPKLPNQISHYRRLINVQEPTTTFCDAVSMFEEQLGMAFLQMHDHFKPEHMDRLEEYLANFPQAIPLAVELRNQAWYAEETIREQLFSMLEKYQKTSVLVDTAGRRDLLHMRLTTPQAFVRYVGANTKSDYTRLDDWVNRIVEWKEAGLRSLYFFVHQNVELESPLLSAYFIAQLNNKLGLHLPIPKTLNADNKQGKLSL